MCLNPERLPKAQSVRKFRRHTGAAGRPPGALLGLCLVVLSLLASSLLPSPALAYLVTDTTFADGSSTASLSFGPLDSSLTGPSLRLLTNSTVTSALLTVEGSMGYSNVSTLRAGDSGFGTAAALDGLRLLNGRLGLDNTTALWKYDANNSFGGGTFSSTAILGSSLVPTGPTGGTYTTPLITNTGDGWGFLSAAGDEPATTNITFRILDSTGSVVIANLEPGSRIGFTSWELPSLSVEVVFSKSATGPTPSVAWFALGQRVEDTYLGAGQPRAPTNLVQDGGQLRSVPEPATLTKYGSNPVISRVASSFRSTFVGQPAPIQVGSEWWMYFGAGSGSDRTGAGIARAVSSDLTSWTVDSGVLIRNGTSGYDLYAAVNPYVMANPVGSGYLMYYTGLTGPAAGSVARATSPDGVNWTKTGQVLTPTAAAWDSVSVGMVSRVTYDPATGSWSMWYSGSDYAPGGGNSIGIATSTDGVAWTKYASNPVLVRGTTNIDRDDAQGGKQIQIGSTVYYYYSCNPGGFYNVCLATSTNGGYAWSKVGPVINRSVSGWDSENAVDPAVVLSDTSFYLFYSGYQSGMPQIGRASATFKAASLTGRLDLLSGTSPDLISFTKASANPRVANRASTYYSTFLSQPMVIKVNSSWSMYLAAGNQTGYAGASIARATSPDLVNWTLDSAPLLSPTAGTNDSWALANPYVVADPSGSGYRMYYSGHTGATSRHVMLATSPDGVNWTKRGDVLLPSAVGWDSATVGIVGRVEFDASSFVWRMWYTGGSGGATAMGLATSLDGSNWTKYPGNPVMSPSGPYDGSDLQAGKMFLLDDVRYAYYNCNNGAWRICLASSSDGVAWTKAGFVLNASTTGWDAVQVSDAFPLLNNTTLHMFFAGVGSTGRAQVGRAVGAFDPSAPRPRLADLPRAFARFEGALSAGSGSSATLSLRSSLDGITWSAAEPVLQNDSTLTTPVRRFVEYTVAFTAGSGRSSVSSAALALFSSRDSGRWLDTGFAYADPYDLFAAAAVYAGTGAIDLALSTDGGSNFTPLVGGVPLAVSGSPTAAAVEGRFRGHASGTLELVFAAVSARTFGLPADVSVSAGAAGTPVSLGAGPLAGSANVSLDAGELNAAIAAALAANASATHVDVPLTVRSSHFGVVNLALVGISYILKNPLEATFDPPGSTATLPENSSAAFSVAATTFGGAPLNYTWTLDDVLLSETGPNFTYTPGFDDAGTHMLNASVENGDFTLAHSWSVDVTNVNRPPVFLETEPADGFTQSHGSPVVFRVRAVDADPDALLYTWTLDGSADLAQASNTTTYSGLASGAHTVQVSVDDGADAIVYAWTFTLTNAAPSVSSLGGPPATVSRGAPVTFTGLATDPDGDPLVYAWMLDGSPVAGGASNTTTLTGLALGAHTVVLWASDGATSANVTWTFSVLNTRPSITAFTGLDGTADYATGSTYTVTATDADGDTLSYAWTVNGAPRTGASPTTLIVSGTAGTFTIVVTVSDGTDSASHTWNLRLTNAPPTIASREPAAASDTAAPQTFTVAGADAENASLSFEWFLDGASAGTGASFTTPAGLPPGAHTVEVRVSDPLGANSTSSWSFTVPTPAPPAGTAGVDPLVLALVAVAAAGGLGAVLFMRKRKAAP